MRQVFQNLVDNAIKYMNRSEGGLIEVRYWRTQSFHTFCVADNGPGIPPEEQDKVFQVFHRANSAATAGVPGKGVGLTLVKSIASNYGGRTWVRSQVGQGAAFFLGLDIRNTTEPIERVAHA